jgi:NDP-sugar pyrophosphorylase family protein
MKGVILAAGTGTRLKPLTRDLPKPLVSLLGRPLIDYTIEAFVQAGFTELGIVVGYKDHLLRRYLSDGTRYGIRIQYLPNTHYWRGNATSDYSKTFACLRAKWTHALCGSSGSRLDAYQ